MATFFENLRESTPNFNNNTVPFFPQTDPIILKQRWNKADWDRFNKDIENGRVKGTEKYYENERNTVRAMDNIYADLSLKFQDYFYNKYYDPSKGDEDVPDDEILKESTTFIQDQAENSPLKDIRFDNGESFYENFRKYGYDKNLLPGSDDKVTWLYRDGETRKVPELRYDKVFPFRVEPYTIREHLGDKRVFPKKPI